MAWVARRQIRPQLQYYDIPDGVGGTMRLQLSRKPDEKTIQALQDLARIVRNSARERGADSVTPEFEALLNPRTASPRVPTESPEPLGDLQV